MLCTFMAEVYAIVNGRPLVSVSTDPGCPEILSPNALLTHKLGGDMQEIIDFTVKDVYKVQWTFKCLQTKFGKDGSPSICIIYKRDKSGSMSIKT